MNRVELMVRHDAGWAATWCVGVTPISRLSVDVPESPDDWPADDGVGVRQVALSPWGSKEFFSGSFVADRPGQGDYTLAAAIAMTGSAVLAFRCDGWYFILPVYCGTLAATPFGQCFSFSPRRTQPLSVRKPSQFEAAVAFESRLLPRQIGGRWADRTEGVGWRKDYCRALCEWGHKAYADRWVSPLAHDPDGSHSGMPW